MFENFGKKVSDKFTSALNRNEAVKVKDIEKVTWEFQLFLDSEYSGKDFSAKEVFEVLDKVIENNPENKKMLEATSFVFSGSMLATIYSTIYGNMDEWINLNTPWAFIAGGFAFKDMAADLFKSFQAAPIKKDEFIKAINEHIKNSDEEENLKKHFENILSYYKNYRKAKSFSFSK